MVILTKKLLNPDREKEKILEDAWATYIKSRDNWSCVICGSQYHPNAHHIVPREHKCYKFELDNGITLCTKHHKFSRVISAHNNPLAFFLWLQRYYPSFYSVAVERNKELMLGEILI